MLPPGITRSMPHHHFSSVKPACWSEVTMLMLHVEGMRLLGY